MHRRLAVGLALLTALSGFVACRTKSAHTQAGTKSPHRIVWAGDILLGANGAKVLAAHEPEWPFEHVRSLLDGDYVIGNAEGPITELKERYFPKQRWHYNAPTYQAKVLADVGFDAVSLANNHLLDRGPDGVTDTMKYLREAGVKPFGAGRTEEAEQPLFVDTPYGKVGVVAFSVDKRGKFLSSDEQLGLRPLTREAFDRGFRLAKEGGAKFTVAFPHWGSNYSKPKKSQRRQARDMVDAGFDLVIGHHPHVAQEVERIGDVFVFYSLGNFVFSTEGRFTEEFPGRGLILRSELGPAGFERFELRCVLTDNKKTGYQPRPCDEEQTKALMSELGPDVRYEDGMGVVTG